MGKNYYWDAISQIIGNILKSNISRDRSILEIGFSSGHFLEWLSENGYQNLHGIEIRKSQYIDTVTCFKNKGLDRIDLILGDILQHNHQYDAIFSTGLIQCLDEKERKLFFRHVSKLANTAVFTIPVIEEDRNIDSKIEVAVAGCTEYITSNIPYELSLYYDIVRTGIINKKKTHIEDTFQYFICNNKMDL